MRKILLTALISCVCLPGQAQKDSVGKKPDMTKMAYEDIKWMKADNKAFWFYYKPTEYMFKSDEFETISMENGDFIAFIFGMNRYVLLSGFLGTPINVEKTAEPIANTDCVLIKINRGRIWIYDKGKYVNNLERAGYIERTHQYVYRSALTDKRYWIDEKDLLYGPINTPIGIVAE